MWLLVITYSLEYWNIRLNSRIFNYQFRCKFICQVVVQARGNNWFKSLLNQSKIMHKSAKIMHKSAKIMHKSAKIMHKSAKIITNLLSSCEFRWVWVTICGLLWFWMISTYIWRLCILSNSVELTELTKLINQLLPPWFQAFWISLFQSDFKFRNFHVFVIASFLFITLGVLIWVLRAQICVVSLIGHNFFYAEVARNKFFTL
jgi:hypothetical protein